MSSAKAWENIHWDTKSSYHFSGSSFPSCVCLFSLSTSLLNSLHASCYRPPPHRPDNVWSRWQTFLMASGSDTYNTGQVSVSLDVSHVSKHYDMISGKLLNELHFKLFAPGHKEISRSSLFCWYRAELFSLAVQLTQCIHVKFMCVCWSAAPPCVIMHVKTNMSFSKSWEKRRNTEARSL